MKTYRAAQSRFGGIMLEKDFGELYAYLACFYGTYAIEEQAVKQVLDTVAWAYAAEYGYEDPSAIKALRNSRGAGRKRKTSQEMKQTIKELAKSGLSIREITAKTGIPKSTVQRMLS